MMTDAPRYVSGDELKKRKIEDFREKVKGQNALGFFQTRLSNRK